MAWLTAHLCWPSTSPPVTLIFTRTVYVAICHLLFAFAICYLPFTSHLQCQPFAVPFEGAQLDHYYNGLSHLQASNTKRQFWTEAKIDLHLQKLLTKELIARSGGSVDRLAGRRRGRRGGGEVKVQLMGNSSGCTFLTVHCALCNVCRVHSVQCVVHSLHTFVHFCICSHLKRFGKRIASYLISRLRICGKKLNPGASCDPGTNWRTAISTPAWSPGITSDHNIISRGIQGGIIRGLWVGLVRDWFRIGFWFCIHLK